MDKDIKNFRDPEDITFQEALNFIAAATKSFHDNRHEDFVAGFASNARIRYASFPEMHGPEELQQWIDKRKRRQLNYKMDKRAVAAMGNIICATWEGVWQDAVTRKNMQCQAAEVITVNKDGQVSDWYVAMSVWEQDGVATTPLI